MDSISQRGSKEVPLLAFIGKTGCMSDSGLQTTTTLSQQKTSIWQKEDISCLSGTGLPRSFQWKHLDESRDESWSNLNAHGRQGSQFHRWPLSPNCVHFNRFYLFFSSQMKNTWYYHSPSQGKCDECSLQAGIKREYELHPPAGAAGRVVKLKAMANNFLRYSNCCQSFHMTDKSILKSLKCIEMTWKLFE